MRRGAKIVEKAGAWYSFNGERIGQGRENVKNYLRENPEILLKIENSLKQQFLPDSVNVDEDGVILE